MAPVLLLLAGVGLQDLQPTADNGRRHILTAEQASIPARHTKHLEIFGQDMTGMNLFVLDAIDRVQATAPNGGGYFADPSADPLESPVGYPLKLWGNPLFTPKRTTSFCSGATYAALIEAVNGLVPSGAFADPGVLDSIVQQSPSGGRKEDQEGFWGVWNGRSAGLWNALGPMTGMGKRVKPVEARPGDFMHIFWKNGRGHSVVFLGWVEGKKLRYWSSQKGTNGLGDDTVNVSRIKAVVPVRLQNPAALLNAKPGFFMYQDVTGMAPWP